MVLVLTEVLSGFSNLQLDGVPFIVSFQTVPSGRTTYSEADFNLGNQIEPQHLFFAETYLLDMLDTMEITVESEILRTQITAALDLLKMMRSGGKDVGMGSPAATKNAGQL